MRYLSPLRYPGGKARLAPFFARLIHAQGKVPTTYAEPFAGGVGAGLRLLFDGHVDRLLINDLNPGIAAFWRTVTRQPEELCARVSTAGVNLPRWHAERERYLSREGTDIDLGFATFFLNRVNRSGILGGRPIGGLEQQGKWRMGARWNPEGLCRRIRAIGTLADQIEVTELDAVSFLGRLDDPGRTLAYVDPPYLEQGDRLYFSQFSDGHHEALAETLSRADYRWVLTYDRKHEVPAELYEGFRCAEFGITYSAQVKRAGHEYMIFSHDLEVPDMQVTRLHEGRMIA